MRQAKQQRAYQRVRREGLCSFLTGKDARMGTGPILPPLNGAALEAMLRELWAEVEDTPPVRMMVSASTYWRIRRMLGVTVKGSRGRVRVWERRGRWRVDRMRWC